MDVDTKKIKMQARKILIVLSINIQLILVASCTFLDNQIVPHQEFEVIGNGLIRSRIYNGDTLVKEYHISTDSVMNGDYSEYYSNGIQKVKGQFVNGSRFRDFEYFNLDGKLRKIEKYSINLMTNNIELGEYILFDDSGDTNWSKSYFYEIKTAFDTLNVGNPFLCTVILKTPRFNSICGYFAVMLQSDFGNSFTLNPIKGEHSRLNISVDSIDKPGDYLLYGRVEDYSVIFENQVPDSNGRATILMIPFVVR